MERQYYPIKKAAGLANFSSGDLIHLGAQGKLELYALMPGCMATRRVRDDLKDYELPDVTDRDRKPNLAPLTGPYLLSLLDVRRLEAGGDPRVQAVVEQIRECETAQAIDRLRLVHADEPKEAFLLSNVPTAVLVDELRSWKEIIYGSRIEQALAKYRGVLPLAPAWLALNCPELWESEGAARNDVTRLGQYDQSSNSSYIRRMSKLTYNYWLAGQTNPARALRTFPVLETQNALTKLLGVPVVLREGHKQMALPKYFGGMGMACLAPREAAGFGFSEEAAPA